MPSTIEIIRMLKQARDLVRDAQLRARRLGLNGGVTARLDRIIEQLNEEAARLGN